MEPGSDDLSKFKTFLEEFTSKHNGPITADDPLPFRLVTYRLTREEIEGECIEWAMEYLHGHNRCPPVYAAAVAKATVDAVLSSDISEYEADREEEEGKLIEANGFARYVFSTVHRICEEWNTNLPTFDHHPNIHQVSLHAIRNTRRKMEDKHVILQDLNAMFSKRLKHLNDKPRAFYAVYDGHGGVDASYYAAAHLHLHTVQQPDFTKSPTSAMKKAFNETDEAFIRKANREGLRSGSTGVAVVVEPDTVHLAWLGDSQAVLMRDGKPVVVMEPHKPEREDEKKRIEQLGGCVVWFGAWRVNGSLAVSRSIGDPEYKPYVCSDADTAILPLDGTEECLILACDGLWDVVTPEDACSTIKEYISNGDDLSSVAVKLVSMAKEGGSNDNITVLVVFLNPHRPKEERHNAEDGVTVASEKGEGTSNLDDTESQSTNTSEEQETNSSVDNSGDVGCNVVQNAVETNLNNNNVNPNSGHIVRKDSKSSRNSPKGKKGLVIKNGMNVVSSPLQPRPTRGSSGNLSQSGRSSVNRTPDLITDYAKTNSMPLVTRRSSLNKKKTRAVRRSISEPPDEHRKSSAGGMIEDVTITDLGVITQKMSNLNAKKVPPLQHKSMPITIKPKSLNRTRSLPRDPQLAAVMKTKLAASSRTQTRYDIQR